MAYIITYKKIHNRKNVKFQHESNPEFVYESKLLLVNRT
jgi:hypothetical protein